ncbi:uncharacterized protein LOC123314062 [Coccinella septempunctata]|uniref:uncharacterized protein LOC123314062 n=1 Tax=Coccinella septempunctata TaxID=41139 RepID=UPI001D08B3B5|nr:uncharacterized protein LOC123314062 [Coccinella septempunctata]
MAELCKNCQKGVADEDEAVFCNGCDTWMHRLCINMSQRTYVRISKSSEEWFCDPCIQQQPNKTAKRNKNKTTTQGIGQSKEYTLADVMSKLDDMDKKYNALFIKYNEQIEINKSLQLEVSEIKKILNEREQRDLESTLIVHGVPRENDENVQDIVENLVTKLEVEIQGKVLSAYRVGKTTGRAAPIRISMENKSDKINMIKSCNKIKLTAKALGYKSDEKIFLNHDLTKANRQLYKEARDFKYRNGYKYLWIKEGNIFLRKDDNSKILLVRDSNDLEN